MKPFSFWEQTSFWFASSDGEWMKFGPLPARTPASPALAG
jgi:hypothetical protein